jgi:hypothetical protein
VYSDEYPRFSANYFHILVLIHIAVIWPIHDTMHSATTALSVPDSQPTAQHVVFPSRSLARTSLDSRPDAYTAARGSPSDGEAAAGELGTNDCGGQRAEKQEIPVCAVAKYSSTSSLA